MRRTKPVFVRLSLLLAAGAVFVPALFAQSVTRSKFTPPVVPETQVNPVLYEATVSGSPATVVFNYNSADRQMYDDGTHGDLVAGDGTWSIQFTPSEILSLNTAARVYRPIVGFCKPTSTSSFNVIGEVWTSAIGLREVRPIDASGQETDYMTNYVATKAQLLTFDPKIWAQHFYLTHGDKYDFLNFILVGGTVGNRGHTAVKNAVQGIETTLFDNTSQYGSAGKLQGLTVFPISTFYDGGEQGFEHETGHQWINFLTGTAFAPGIPHWATGNAAINVMGFSIPGSGGVGGNYPWTFTSNGSGGYVVGPGNPLNITTFNTMELYLMGLAAPAEVGTFFVLNNQSQSLTNGQTLQASEITLVTVNDVIAARGTRVPSSVIAQKNFHCATIVVSEQLLDQYAMALYDFFARRCEAKQQLTYSSGLVSGGTSNPWELATGGRSVMFSKIPDEKPIVGISKPSSLQVQLSFAGKQGIHYQAQSVTDLTQQFMNDSTPLDPVADAAAVLPVSVTANTTRKFYHLLLNY